MGLSPDDAPRAAFLPGDPPAILKSGSLHAATGEVPIFSEGQKTPCPFPPEPPLNWSGGFHGGILPPPFVSRGTDSARGLLPSGVEPEGHGVKKSGASDFTGLRLIDLGAVVAEKL